MARARTGMNQIREILRLRHGGGLSQRKVARASGCSLGTVNKVLRGAARAGLSWPLAEDITEEELQKQVFGKKVAARSDVRRESLDFECMYRELQRRKHLTVRQLWKEYRAVHPDGYGYSQYCHLYRCWRQRRKVTMAQEHKAGEAMFVDYAGATVEVHAPQGEPWRAQIFMAVLGASSYFYVEASRGQKLESWIGSHVRALHFFGGSPNCVVPDNLKAGVTKASLYEPRVNNTYLEMLRHFGMAVLPARPRRPRDKAKVEQCVQFLSRNILEALRHDRFTSLEQLNAALAEHRERLNSQPFQKRPESRRQLYETVDLPALRPLPEQPYEFAVWLRAKVHLNHHVTVDGHHYSAPVALLQQHVDVRLSEHTVELLQGGQRVALHMRSHDQGGYTTRHEHRPKAHQKYLSWTPQRIQEWAKRVGPCTSRGIHGLLEESDYPQEQQRPSLGIVRLSRHYGRDRVEAASRRALHYGEFSYQRIFNILQSKADRQPLEQEGGAHRSPVEHDNVRGGSYYRLEGDGTAAEGGE